MDTPLNIIEIHRPYKLYVDACEYAIACVLAQQDDDRNDRPVAVASVKLSPSQRAWAIIEKEAYAACRSLGGGCFGLQ